jgi:hypothetical protein
VHPGILYRWEESKPDARKIRTEFKLLGVKQHDVSRLSEGADGSFVIDYLEGANAGTKLIHEFSPEDESATLVKITAHVPAKIHRKLLGPLFSFGVKQVLKRSLREDKADLEGGRYEPSRMAGNVDAAFELLAPLQARLRVLGKAGFGIAELTLEVAALVAAADGEVDAAERDALRRVAAALAQPGLDAEWADAQLQAAAGLAGAGDGEKVTDYAGVLGRKWKELRLGEDGILPAVIVAQASHGVALAELAVLRLVAETAGIQASTIESSLNEVDGLLSKAELKGQKKG